jgi:hypothetical protein
MIGVWPITLGPEQHILQIGSLILFIWNLLKLQEIRINQANVQGYGRL